MERMRRRWFSQEQKTELWERWKNGQSPLALQWSPEQIQRRHHAKQTAWADRR